MGSTIIRTAIQYTDLDGSEAAGIYLGNQILATLGNRSPDALIIFASAKYDYEVLLTALDVACHPGIIVGCSSSGEFVSNQHGEGSACALAIYAPEMSFSAGLGTNLSEDRETTAAQIISGFNREASPSYPYRAALVLTDALAGYVEDLVNHLNLITSGTHRMVGGGAGDDAQFTHTHVFLGTKAYSNAAVALEMLSHNPISVGASHGWVAVRPPMRVTESDGNRLVSLNAISAVEVLQEYADSTGQTFDLDAPLPFFLHNIFGIDTGHGYKLRVPLAVQADGSLVCAAEVPQGSTVSIMGTTDASATAAASRAVGIALRDLGEAEPKVALFFDCVATRLRIGQEFGIELNTLQSALGNTPFIGCNTHGQIARAHGQFHGFHNCTATVCVISG